MFKVGDRVTHAIHGAGEVVDNYSRGFAYRVLFDVQPVKAPNAWNNPLCVMGDTVKEDLNGYSHHSKHHQEQGNGVI